MNGTKWYKLHKSNEPLLIELHEELNNLESKISDTVSSALITAAEIVFSALLTYFIEHNIDMLSFLRSEESASIPKYEILLGTVFSCSFVFFGSMAICKILVSIIGRMIDTFEDNKSDQEKIYNLEKYFYQKTLNDIITGISLEKKSQELEARLEVDTDIRDQNKNLSSIYLIESVFYFHEALKSIADKRIIEVANPNRKEYTDFLEAVNPCVVCEIFKICELTLNRIIQKIGEDDPARIKKAKDAMGLFSQYQKNINKQMGF